MKYIGYLMARVKRVGDDQFTDVWDKPKKNLIVNAGVAHVANLLGDAKSTSPTKFTHSRCGSGTTPAAAGNTDIESVLGSGQAVTPTYETTTIADDTEVFTSSHTATGSWAVTEYVLATAVSGGTILNRLVFSAINLSTDDILEFTYKVQVDIS